MNELSAHYSIQLFYSLLYPAPAQWQTERFIALKTDLYYGERFNLLFLFHLLVCLVFLK